MKLYGGKGESQGASDSGKKALESQANSNRTAGTQRKSTAVKTAGKPGAGKKKMSEKRKKKLIMTGSIVLAAILGFWALASLYIQPPSVDHEPPAIDGDKVPEGQKPSTDGSATRKKDYYTFLVAGLDQDHTRADTIMVASYDVPASKVNIVNVPRDTMVDTKTRSIKKINGSFVKGPDALEKELKTVIGFETDRYVIINFDGFEDVINAIGGVTYNVPIRMKYDDPTQDLHIDLQPGVQKLNGKQALHFVRYRKPNPGEKGGYPEGDIGRIKAQQEFIKAVLKQVASPANILKINDIVKAISDNVDTNMPVSEILWFAMQAVKLDGESIEMSILPGEDKYLYEPDYGEMQSYFIPDEKGILEMVNVKLNPYTTPITKLSLRDMSKYGSSKPSSNKGNGNKDDAKPKPKPDPEPEAKPEPPVTDPKPPVTDPEPPVTDPKPPVTDPEPPVTDPKPPVTDPTPPVTDPEPPVTDPTPPVTDPKTPVPEDKTPEPDKKQD